MIYLETLPTSDPGFVRQLNALPPEVKKINGYTIQELVQTSPDSKNIRYRAEGPNGLPVFLKLLRSSQTYHNQLFRREVAFQERASQLSRFVLPIENSGSVTLPFTNPDIEPGEGEFSYLVTPFFPDGTMGKATSTPENREHLLRFGLLSVGLGLDRFGKEIVHRDIAPQNVMMRKGLGHITDFGMAAKLGAPAKLLGGTPGFMAPEQVQEDEEARHETDIRAAAVLAHNIHRGIPFMPFVASETISLLRSEWTYDSYLYQKLAGLEAPLQDVF